MRDGHRVEKAVSASRRCRDKFRPPLRKAQGRGFSHRLFQPRRWCFYILGRITGEEFDPKVEECSALSRGERVADEEGRVRG